MSSSVDWCEVMAPISLPTYDNRVVLDRFYHYCWRSCWVLDHNWVCLNWSNSCANSNIRWWWIWTWSWCRRWCSWGGSRGGSWSRCWTIRIWLNLCGVCLSWNCSCWVLISCVSSYWSLECCVSCCVCCNSSSSNYGCSSSSWASSSWTSSSWTSSCWASSCWASSWRICCRVGSITCSCNSSCINSYWVVCVNTGVGIYRSTIIDGCISCSTYIASLP